MPSCSAVRQRGVDRCLRAWSKPADAGVHSGRDHLLTRHPGCTTASVLIRAMVGLLLVGAVSCAHTIDTMLQDAEITAAVTTALLNNRSIDGTLVSVRTEAGVVHVSGTQPSAEAASQVVSVVRSVMGVQEVQSSISVAAVPSSPGSSPP
jgi:hypothetical protein